MPSCNTYHLTWVSLTLACGISSRLLQQSTATVPYLGRGVSPYRAVPDLQCGIAPLGPPVPVQPPLLRLLFPAAGPGLGHVGGSFQLPSLALGSGWLLRVTALIEDLKKKKKDDSKNSKTIYQICSGYQISIKI